jgi:NAD+-dependent protein deacetylase SIR2
VDAGLYTAKKLLSAFGIRAPAFLEGADDSAYFSLLSLAISRELSKRAKLTRFNTVDDAVDLLKKSRNIIVLTGAGISTSLGIPDFRSKGTGLYSKLEHLGLSDPQEVFDIATFKEDPTIFFSVAKDILPSATSSRYSPTHKFIAMLQDQGKLLTNYTQNIDNIETYAGVRPEKMVQCHGSFGTATCQQCKFQTKGDKFFPDIRAGKIPRCPRCVQNLRGGSTKRKRSHGYSSGNKRRRWGASAADDSASDSEFDIPTAGVMKPDITFFGEPLPDEFARRLTEHDRDAVDLVVVIGTSLKVTPVSEIVSWLPAHVPQMYISKTPITHINFDIDLLGDCDLVVSELCRRAGWEMSHEMIPRGQKVEVVREPGFVSRHLFTQVGPAVKTKLESLSPPDSTGERQKGMNGVLRSPAMLNDSPVMGAFTGTVATNGSTNNGTRKGMRSTRNSKSKSNSPE